MESSWHPPSRLELSIAPSTYKWRMMAVSCTAEWEARTYSGCATKISVVFSPRPLYEIYTEDPECDTCMDGEVEIELDYCTADEDINPGKGKGRQNTSFVSPCRLLRIVPYTRTEKSHLRFNSLHDGAV